MFPIIKFFRPFILKNKFETIRIIGKIKKPILFCRSENDELIHKKQMEDLFNAANCSIFKNYYIIKNGTHNDGFKYDNINYAQALKEFMNICIDETFPVFPCENNCTIEKENYYKKTKSE